MLDDWVSRQLDGASEATTVLIALLAIGFVAACAWGLT